MATEVAIRGTENSGKIRNPLGVIGLTLITFGIYWLFWYYTINREMADIGRSRGSTETGNAPGTSLLAVTLGAFVVIPAIMSSFGTWKRLNATEQAVGLPIGLGAVPGFLLTLFIGPVGIWFLQSNLNKALEAQAQA